MGIIQITPYLLVVSTASCQRVSCSNNVCIGIIRILLNDSVYCIDCGLDLGFIFAVAGDLESIYHRLSELSLPGRDGVARRIIFWVEFE